MQSFLYQMQEWLCISWVLTSNVDYQQAWFCKRNLCLNEILNQRDWRRYAWILEVQQCEVPATWMPQSRQSRVWRLKAVLSKVYFWRFSFGLLSRCNQVIRHSADETLTFFADGSSSWWKMEASEFSRCRTRSFLLYQAAIPSTPQATFCNLMSGPSCKIWRHSGSKDSRFWPHLLLAKFPCMIPHYKWEQNLVLDVSWTYTQTYYVSALNIQPRDPLKALNVL